MYKECARAKLYDQGDVLCCCIGSKTMKNRIQGVLKLSPLNLEVHVPHLKLAVINYIVDNC